MKKFAKITGIALLSALGLLVVIFLLLRFCFREQVAEYLNGMQQKERTELLRNAGPYAADTVQYRFTYARDSVHAREIRKYFRLDTLVSPSATTWDNTLALAKFVARNIPHANQTVYPEQSNARGLWEYTRTVEPAFNCRLHSILLHELLLASDITNRFVTCLPADSLDTECHVVNVVWLPERQKWAMIDSDMQAFITSSDGTPLSLEEMRRSYIDDKPMEIHRLLEKKNDVYYRAYWAKNLYRFSCWEQAGYDLETKGQNKGRTIHLVPQGFASSGLSDTAVITTDEARFWAAPTL